MAPEYQLLTDLGFDPRDVYKVGAWFLVPEKAITLVPAKAITGGSGSPFSPHKAVEGGKRPVVLASPWGPSPDLVFFPRTSSRWGSGYSHDMHDHRSAFPECVINQDGTVLNIRVAVKAPELSPQYWSCAEPESSGLHAEMERWRRP